MDRFHSSGRLLPAYERRSDPLELLEADPCVSRLLRINLPNDYELQRICTYNEIVTVVGCLYVVYVLDELKPLNRSSVEEGRITEIVSHHNRRIQGTEIQGCNWNIVIAFLWLDDSGTFVLFIGTCGADINKLYFRKSKK